MDQVATKKARQDTDFSLCIQCQDQNAHKLVSEPSLEAYTKFLQFVHERGQYGDAEYPQISRRLEHFTATDLKDRKAKWHRACYGSTCHSGHMERARVRYQKACHQEEGQYLNKNVAAPPLHMSVPQILP